MKEKIIWLFNRCQKIFEKIQYPFIIKILNKQVIEGKLLGTVKVTHDRTTANIMLSGLKLKDLPLRSETKQRWPFLPFLFHIILETLATVS